jgi:hypothetical protein
MPKPGGHLLFVKGKFPDVVGEVLYGFPCRVDGRSAEGVITGDQQSFQGAALLFMFSLLYHCRICGARVFLFGENCDILI